MAKVEVITAIPAWLAPANTRPSTAMQRETGLAALGTTHPRPQTSRPPQDRQRRETPEERGDFDAVLVVLDGLQDLRRGIRRLWRRSRHDDAHDHQDYEQDSTQRAVPLHFIDSSTVASARPSDFRSLTYPMTWGILREPGRSVEHSPRLAL